jgi:hypothetical protein
MPAASDSIEDTPRTLTLDVQESFAFISSMDMHADTTATGGRGGESRLLKSNSSMKISPPRPN